MINMQTLQSITCKILNLITYGWLVSRSYCSCRGSQPLQCIFGKTTGLTPLFRVIWRTRPRLCSEDGYPTFYFFPKSKEGLATWTFWGVSTPPRSTNPLYRLVIPLRCSSVCLCTCENRFWRSEKVCIISTDPGDDRPGIWRSADPWGIVDSWSDSWCLWIFHPPTSLAPRPLLGMVDEMHMIVFNAPFHFLSKNERAWPLYNANFS